MNSVNKTLYIPLYGKSYVTERGLFLKDPTARVIWEREGFPLRGKAKSKWLAFYMGIRAAVFDEWVKERAEEERDAVILHLGCGLDSRALRVNAENMWYDVDFPAVIEERRRYFSESDTYKMIEGDLREGDWLSAIPDAKCAIAVMEGVSMYLSPKERGALFERLGGRFDRVLLLMDCYTEWAARLSKRRNPVHGLGVGEVFGVDDPCSLEKGGIVFSEEKSMTPPKYVAELRGMERHVFRRLYAGKISRRLYRLFEYRKDGAV